MFDDLTSIRFEDYEHDVRVDVLRRLAEQAMSDEAFRAVAREDLLAGDEIEVRLTVVLLDQR